MEKTLIIALFALACAVFALLAASGALLAGWFYARKLQARVEPAQLAFERISALETWTQEADAQAAQAEQEDAEAAKSEQMRQLAYKSQAVQAERKEEAAQVFQAGQAVISGPGTEEEKKNALLALVQQHPQVALGVAQKLNRQFGIAKAIGMKEADFIGLVADLAGKAIAKMQASGPASSQQNAGKEFGGLAWPGSL